MEDKFFRAALQAMLDNGGVEGAVESKELEWLRKSEATTQAVRYLFDGGWLDQARDDDERSRSRGTTLLFIFAAERLSHERQGGEIDNHDRQEALCHMGTHGVRAYKMTTVKRRERAADERRRPIGGTHYQKSKYEEEMAHKLARELHLLTTSSETLQAMLNTNGDIAIQKYLFSSGYKRKKVT